MIIEIRFESSFFRLYCRENGLETPQADTFSLESEQRHSRSALNPEPGGCTEGSRSLGTAECGTRRVVAEGEEGENGPKAPRTPTLPLERGNGQTRQCSGPGARRLCRRLPAPGNCRMRNPERLQKEDSSVDQRNCLSDSVFGPGTFLGTPIDDW